MSAHENSLADKGTHTVAMAHTTANNMVLTAPGTRSEIPDWEINNGKAYMHPATTVANNQGYVLGYGKMNPIPAIVPRKNNVVCKG